MGIILDEGGNTLLDEGGQPIFDEAGDPGGGGIIINPTPPSAEWTNVYVEFLVDLSAVPKFVLELLLAERNQLGAYFDGDKRRGGWLLGTPSIGDYRWAGAANASVSIFSEDYQRTNAILDALLWEVLPVTEVDKYDIVSYNAVPGLA